MKEKIKAIWEKLLTPENKEILIKRFKSLFWRISMMALVALVDFISQSLGLFNLPPGVVTVLGLALGEVSKILNKK